jgi:hypothetical protein
MYQMKQLMLFCAISCLVAITFGQAGHPANSLGAERFLARQGPIVLPEQKSTTMLAFMRAMLQARAPGGIATVSTCGEEPKYDFGEARNSLPEALDTIVHHDPTNRWENKEGVVNLIPAHHIPALLELPVAEFRVKNAKSVIEALDHLLKLPEVQRSKAQFHLEELNSEPGLTDLKRSDSLTPEPPGLNVHCRNTTLRGVLNAIALAHGYAVWSYTERHCGGRDEFRIDFVIR